MTTTIDDIRAASALRSVFGRLRPGFYDHEARRFEGPLVARPSHSTEYSNSEKEQDNTFCFSEDGSRLLSVALLVNEDR
jgi:hypothetical protein